MMQEKLEHHIRQLEQDPNDVNLLLEIGQIYLDQNDIDNAMLYLDKASVIQPDTKLLKARILHHLQRLDMAIVVAQDIIAGDSSNAHALGLLALLHFDNNDPDQALDMAAKTLAIDANNYEAKLVTILLGLATQETPIEEIEDLLEENPNDPRLHFALGNTHMTNGNMEAAEHSLQQAIEIYPDFYDAYITLGWCQLLNNKANTASKIYEKATELAPEISDGWAGLAIIHALKADLIKTEKMINKATKLDTDCFLTTIAQSIYHVHKNPKKDNKHLLKALKSPEFSSGEKIMLFIESLS